MKYQLKQHEMKIIFLVTGLICCLLLFSNVASSTTEYAEMSSNLNPNPPNNPVRLIFIHHSTGENWLNDENGGLGIALRDHNYFVSDTNYGWGPTYTDNSSTIGDHTDIGNWWEWFQGPNSSTYLNTLYNEGDQHCFYSRLSSAPSGENEIVMFKSCFPNSALQGNPNDPVPSIDNNPLRGQDSSSEYHTVANAKGIYIDILEYFRTRQDKLFIVITAPPLMASDTNTSQAANARAFNNWLMNDWLRDYPYNNLFVSDFYNVLTSNGGDPDTNDLGSVTGNHHRWWNGAIQHIQPVNNNMAAYPTGDSHPSQAGNLKATGEFLDLLNIAYNRWKGINSGNSYYVAKTGDDSNPGSEAQPWLSIQKAANTLVAGDTVYIKTGTYNERVVPQNSGNAGNYITYAAFPGDTVTIDGTGVDLPEWTGLFDITGKAYIKVSGLRVTNARVNPHNLGIQADTSSHVIIEKNYVYNTNDSGIGIWSSSDVTVDYNEVEKPCQAAWNESLSVGGTDGFEVKYNRVHDSPKEGICIKDGSANGKVYGNQVHQTQAVGIYIDAEAKHTYNIEVFQNIVHDSSDGIGTGSETGGLLENVKIYNNISFNNSFLGINIHRYGVASVQVQPLHQIEVINNTVYNNGLSGWGGCISVSNPDVQGIVIQNNICSQNLSFQIVVLTAALAQALITVDYNLIDGFREYIDVGASEIRGIDYVEGDPKFINPSGADFRLQEGSPAIDKGSPLNAPTNDYDGNIRPYGAGYDIGAYEYGAGSPPPETVSTPSAPNGQGSGIIGTEYSFTTGGATSSLNDPIEYRFDWGDGTFSDWSSSSEASKWWSNADNYLIKAQARCANHPSVESGWSDPLTVTISAVGPDLTGEWTVPVTQSCKNTRAGQKCTIKGTLTVNNIGNRDSVTTSVNFYLSEDGVTYQEEDLIKRVSLSKIKAGKSKVLKLSYSFPVRQPATGRYVIAVIDGDDLVAEINEDNNT